jgi:hypothetical protein
MRHIRHSEDAAGTAFTVVIAVNEHHSAHLAARVPADLAARFERIAAREDRTVSQELRRLIRHHVTAHNDDDLAGHQVGRPNTPAVQEPAHGP